MGISLCKSSAHPQSEVMSGGEDAGWSTDPTDYCRYPRAADPRRVGSPGTPFCPLVFFAQFLATEGLFSSWVGRCPLRFTSPNARQVNDLLGTQEGARAWLQSPQARASIARLPHADDPQPEAGAGCRGLLWQGARGPTWDGYPLEAAGWSVPGAETRPDVWDANYGNQTLMEGCETRGRKYLFRLRQSHRVMELVRLPSAQAGRCCST
jgi:hypothetical protein